LKTLAIGEVLWDIVDNQALLGGAPFNVAAHLARMGVESYLVSSIGKDNLGHKILETAGKMNVNTQYISINEEKPTGTVDVFLQNGQPDYNINEDVAWDEIRLSPTHFDQIISQSWDCVIFGSLAQRSKHNRILFKKLLPKIHSGEFFMDINLRKRYFSRAVLQDSIDMATILKLNNDEVREVSVLLFHAQLTMDAFAARIQAEYQVPVICITLGEEGAIVYGESKIAAPGIPTNVEDTIGAGDSFSAAFIRSYLEKSDLALAAEMGCMLGSFVASRSGAIPEYTQEVKKKLGILNSNN